MCNLENSEHLAFLSTDTTGFGLDDELLRITIMDSDGNILLNQMVFPPNKISWNEAQLIHGISTDDIEINAISLDELHEKLKSVLANYTHIVMYNADFHKRFLPSSVLENKSCICVMQWSIPYVNNHPSYAHLSAYLKLPVLAAFLDVEISDIIRNSINNCNLTRKVWIEMLRSAKHLENDVGDQLLISSNINYISYES